MKRLTVLISLVGLFSLAFAAPVLAAAPGNDDAASPTVIGSLPFTDSLDTTNATAAPADPDCFESGTNASVWYAYTTGTDPVTLISDTFESNYATTITVVTGSPAGEIVACGFDYAQFSAEPSTAYYFMVASCFNFGEVGPEAGALAIGPACEADATGGSLLFHLNEAPPPPAVDLAVDPIGSFNKQTGSATITGTVLCTGEAFFSEIYVELTQAVGRFTVLGYADLYPEAFVCDGTAQPWSAEVLGITGQFKGGRAAAVVFAVACGQVDCGIDEVQQAVRLR
jgi:hypothetical protein